jgi:hypothetical protein
VVLGAAGIGTWTYLQMASHAEHQRFLHEQELQRAELERLDEEQRRQIASSSLTRPWTLTPKLSPMLHLCEEAIDRLPITIGGWLFERAQCTPAKLDATYIRTTGTTNVGYLREFAKVFPSGEVKTEIKDDTTAGFSVSINMPAGGDELNQLLPNVRDAFVSHFQRTDHAVKVEQIDSQAIVPAFLPNGTPWPSDALAPAPIWNTYAFVFESATRPSNAMRGLPEEGIRAAIVEVLFKEDSVSFSWKTVGELYGQQ